jgi:hypothetical protein
VTVRSVPPGPRPTQRTDNCGRSMTSQLKRAMLDPLCCNPRPGSKPSVVDRLAARRAMGGHLSASVPGDY